MATQAVAAKNAGSDPDFKTTGTAQCVVAGTFVASLAAQATIDMSDADVAEPLDARLSGSNGLASALAGKIVADNGQFYLLVTTESDGTPHVYWAHSNVTAEDDAAPTLKVPYYPAATELAIGLILYDNDGTAGAFTIGTTNVVAADDTYYQLTGPSLIPHVDFWDKN
ncbi:MAG: hypothetical protein ACYS32_19395 [Planctomycetota bacterium]